MDGFALIAVGGLVLLFLVFLAIGKWYPGTGADVLDWTPTRSVETEIELELDDIDQMLEAQNERRRRRGEPDRTEDDVRADVAATEREIQDRAAGYDRGRREALGGSSRSEDRAGSRAARAGDRGYIRPRGRDVARHL